MAYSIRITDAEKMTVQDSGEHLLSVLFTVSKDGEPVRQMRHGFSLDTTVEELEAEAAKLLDTFVRDTENGERTAEFAAKDAQADKTIAAMVGKEITQ